MKRKYILETKTVVISINVYQGQDVTAVLVTNPAKTIYMHTCTLTTA